MATRDQAAAADPKRVLDSMLATREFAGVPVLVLDTDTLPSGLDEFEHHVMDRIAVYGDQNSLAVANLNEAFRYYEDGLRMNVRYYRETSGQVPSCVALFPADQEKSHIAGAGADTALTAAILLAPGAECRPEKDMAYCAGLIYDRDEPLLQDNTSWRFYTLCHELAHVAGAGEPQADKIANLFCRQAFAGSAAPEIQADLRAIEAVNLATELAAGKAADPETSLESLALYGWAMVTSNDAASAIPQQSVATMSGEDILAFRYEHHDDAPDKILALGAMLCQAGLDGLVLSEKIENVAEGARAFVENLPAQAKDPEIHDMARRFALAARRLSEGAPAYDQSAVSGKRSYLRQNPADFSLIPA